MKITLTPSLFKGLIAKYSLDVVVLLKLIENGVDLASFCEGAKLTALLQTIIRKGLVNDEATCLTTTGRELLDLVDIEWEQGDEVIPISNNKIVLSKPKSSLFDEWWAVYPTSDAFSLRGKTFGRTRALKVDPDGCRVKFDKVILEGKYTVEEMKKAVETEVKERQNKSIREGRNNLTFMVASSVYLNQKRYESYIEDMRKGIGTEQERSTFDGVNI